MIYYPDVHDKSTGVKISYAKFEKIFGVKYSECEDALYMNKDRKTKRHRFVDSHCCECPYAADINGLVIPIINNSYDVIKEFWFSAADDI